MFITQCRHSSSFPKNTQFKSKSSEVQDKSDSDDSDDESTSSMGETSLEYLHDLFKEIGYYTLLLQTKSNLIYFVY
jgi:hypothetical protein